MSQRHEIRSYDYVNHPYEKVHTVLAVDATGVFRAATKAAASRAQSVAASLHVDVAGLEVGADIELSVGEIIESGREADASQVMRIPIEWQAAQRPYLFPLMSAVLSVYPLTATETQLDFHGHYDPPLGKLGGALDAVVGKKIAEASVHRLIGDVARYLREELA